MLTLKRNTDTLASGALADAIVMRLAINGSIIIDEQNCVRADFVSIFSRGNHRNALNFTIGKLHDTELEAEEFRAKHAQEITGRADWSIERTKNGQTFSALLRNAGWRSVAVQLDGIYTRTTYEVVGGRIETAITGAVAEYIDGGTAGDAFTDPREIIHGGTAGDGAIFYSIFDGGVAA